MSPVYQHGESTPQFDLYSLYELVAMMQLQLARREADTEGFARRIGAILPAPFCNILHPLALLAWSVFKG